MIQPFLPHIRKLIYISPLKNTINTYRLSKSPHSPVTSIPQWKKSGYLHTVWCFKKPNKMSPQYSPPPPRAPQTPRCVGPANRNSIPEKKERTVPVCWIKEFQSKTVWKQPTVWCLFFVVVEANHWYRFFHLRYLEIKYHFTKWF